MVTGQDEYAFSGEPESHAFAGLLFDLDGTIINTTGAITKHWKKSVDNISSVAYMHKASFLLNGNNLQSSAELVLS